VLCASTYCHQSQHPKAHRHLYGKGCEVIPNGVVFADPPRENDKLVELGLEPGRYVLTVGRIVPEKRQLDLLHAFHGAGLKGWKLAIVGRIDHKNKYADLLASEAALAEDVVMAGFQSGDSLRQLYAHAGLFVLPSSHEGLPIVLLEALSYGLPVLVSDIPSNLEVVDDADRVFRMGNIAELSTKIRALSGLGLNATDREAVRLNCVRRYNWTEIARKTSAAYEVLVNSKSTVPFPRLNLSPRHSKKSSKIWDRLRQSLRAPRQRPRHLP
jgi:glycosyltransferase involved in cell wall biosynthesis